LHSMFRRFLISVVALAASLALVPGAYAADSTTVTLAAENNSGETGTATLTAMGDNTQVVLNLTGAPAGTPQPAHIHIGTCPGVGAVKYPLSPVVEGKSTTMVKAKLADISTGGFAINVHKSAAEVSVYVSCGTIAAVAGATAAPAASTAPAKTNPTVAPATGGGYGATHNQTPFVPAGAAVIVLAVGALALRRKLA